MTASFLEQQDAPASPPQELPWQDPLQEWVLLVPPKLAKSSYAILVAAQCVFRPWHLQGRYGSRTHPHDDDDDNDKRIAIPVLSQDLVLHQCTLHTDLQELLETDGVQLVYKAFTPSNRAPQKAAGVPDVIDGRIHPERAPTTNNWSYSKQPSRMNSSSSSLLPSFTYIELFAGIGGFAVALDALGGKCILASEIEESCQRVYRHNFPGVRIEGDIYDISNQDLRDLLQQQSQSCCCDLLVGGFPCQPFSAMGEQPGLECPKAGNLFLEIVRFLRICRPQAFLLENVPGLLAMKDDTFATILEALKGAGYSVTYEVCDARGLTATSRKRLFLVGLLQQPPRQDVSSSSSTSLLSEVPQPFEFPFIPDLQIQTQHVVSYNPHDLSPLEQELLPISDAQLQQLNGKKKKKKRWRPGSHLAWPQTKCSTIVSHYGNAIGRGESQLVPCLAAGTTLGSSNGNPRRFSPTEGLRIMGFPVGTNNDNEYHHQHHAESSSFRFPAKETSKDYEQGDMAFYKEQYHMVGNAVCPPLIAAITGAILARIDLKESSSTCDSKVDEDAFDWVEHGRRIAVDLAYRATLTGYTGECVMD